jgi:D-glycerate 3-kinase
VTSEWLWGVGFPLLTTLEQHARLDSRSVVGLSGLPGCGKSSLAAWVQQVSQELGLAVAAVSLDDFYWSADQMDLAMAGNPWSVPRGLPGSHDLALMQRCLQEWRAGADWNAPCFDKSLREGRGDRAGWHSSAANVVLLEGWFLGVSPEASNALDPVLSVEEHRYRPGVLESLKSYLPFWSELSELWHLRAPNVSATRLWKSQQEANMEKKRGVRLPDHAFAQFIRMIESALPQEALQTISQADVVVELTESRVIRELR